MYLSARYVAGYMCEHKNFVYHLNPRTRVCNILLGDQNISVSGTGLLNRGAYGFELLSAARLAQACKKIAWKQLKTCTPGQVTLLVEKQDNDST